MDEGAVKSACQAFDPDRSNSLSLDQYIAVNSGVYDVNPGVYDVNSGVYDVNPGVYDSFFRA